MRPLSLCAISLLACALLSACSTQTPAPSSTPASASSNQALVETFPSAPHVQEQTPDASWDIPAYQPDVATSLSYTLDGITHTVPALRHYSAQGYSITYDPTLFQPQSWEDGDAYLAGTGTYLSINRIHGMDALTVRQGLILQEDIPDQGQQVQIGLEHETAYTLVVSPKDGVYRQFWIVDQGSTNTLLVEQAYQVDGADAPLYQAMQQAMLSTLTLE